MMVENDVSEQLREGFPKRAVRPTWLRAQPEYISWKGMMSQTEDSKEPTEDQHDTSEDVKNEDSDWENISRREVNNCKDNVFIISTLLSLLLTYLPTTISIHSLPSKTKHPISPSAYRLCPSPNSQEDNPSLPTHTRESRINLTSQPRQGSSDYYGNYVKERPVEQGEWLAVNEVPIPQSTAEWFKPAPKDKRSRTSSSTSTSSSVSVKGWVNGMRKCLRPKKPEARITDEAYVEINTSGESESESDADTDDGLPPRLVPRGGVRQQRRAGNGRDSRWAGRIRDATRLRGSGCRIFYVPMMA
ncbi:hypothetical protein F4813DRAFT_397620 [Daldinia decipiens]|uniref:uncharacterized protein n=1 Tax=Daldinia decipiens TaxID=326647 RepID=UPI0020C2AB57|nr:uncharacterized protein F4813DRAFT_397620 [Daldinia decipiens]KAI1656165.1 hypothetical protein F4813DRAFT_397620 [Daldinia decipiens]